MKEGKKQTAMVVRRGVPPHRKYVALYTTLSESCSLSESLK